MEALCAETQISMCSERKLQKKQRIMEITELIIRIFKSKNWGVYYKSQPMQKLETKDGSALYGINKVDELEIETEIEKALTWESSQTESNMNQNKNSKTG
jgi:NAD kinase